MALTPTRIKLAEFDRSTYAINPPAGSEFEEVLDPRYWAHLAGQLRVGDVLEVKPDDMSWWALLLVTQVGLVQANVAVLIGPVQIDGADVAPDPELEDHVLRFAGGRMRWCVLRVSDREYVFSGGTRDEAVAWMESRAAAVAAAKLKQGVVEERPEPKAAEPEPAEEDASPAGRRRRRASVA